MQNNIDALARLIGTSNESVVHVDKERVISFLGEEIQIYSTPMLLSDVEAACLAYAKSALPDSDGTVGAYVELEHVGAVPLGSVVKITIQPTSVVGRAVEFRFTCSWQGDVIATGVHRRALIDVARFSKKIRERWDARSGMTA